ncbi:T9SS type A sorting domain-containing protein [Taibaiella chishuiensis]|uniref:Putative secreted protein (Por secretion system target) n=1 Tax=Taibaiella chishuiensis TaxID=1434707 RepID=A0A2P8DCB1_9BACT|nr:T9SS type A sorting domain-containing protein [Taibaiella chishuiensis]PSK94856.1 putative secreted protein (Por secretion system target) [Taibaiella chishuiensis]
MKRIYMMLGMIGALATGAYAQKTADLEMTFLQPVNGQNFANLNAGDTFKIFVVIKNNGPAAVTATDTIKITTEGFASDGTDDYNITYTLNSPAIAANSSDTVYLAVRQGQSFGNSSVGPVTARFPTNSNDTLIAYVRGIDGSGVPFTDAGYDPTQDPPVDVAGNNIDFAAFSFGTQTGLKDLFGTKKEALNVYPNPTTGKLTFKYNFENTTGSVRITDIAGRVVLTQEYGKQSGVKEISLDVSSLNNGMYFVELTAGDKQAVSKITVQK